MTIKIPALKRPTLAELQKEWSWIKSIEKDDSPTKAVTLELTTILKDGEDFITGSVYEKRREGLQCLGFQHAQWLLKNQKEFPELMELVGKVYIDFPALVVVGGGGNRYCPCLDLRGRVFVQEWDWLSGGLVQDGRLAVSGKSALKTSDTSLSELGRLENRLLELESFREKVEKVLHLP